MGTTWSAWFAWSMRPQSTHANASRVSTACRHLRCALSQYPRAAALGLPLSSRLAAVRRRSGLWVGMRWGIAQDLNITMPVVPVLFVVADTIFRYSVPNTSSGSE
jgi:hypothetical protein